MKKIIALAVAAVVAAPAMADLTLSGNLTYGYSASDAPYWTDNDLQRLANCQASAAGTVAAPGTDAAVAACSTAAGLPAKSGKGDAGFGVDTAEITLNGSETLENGITVSGVMGLGGLARGETASGVDAVLSVAGDFGKVAVGAVELGHGVFGYGSSVAENFQGELSGAASNSDSISYTAPAMGMVVLSVGYDEAGTGLGEGQDAPFSPSIKAAITASDALSGFIQYTSYGDAGTTTDAENRLRIGAKFDAGVVVASAAMGTTSYEGAKKDLDNMIVGLDLPLGATTLGLNYGQADNGTTKRNGTSVGFKHALSSNLAVSGKYTQYEQSATVDVTKSNLFVSLTF